MLALLLLRGLGLEELEGVIELDSLSFWKYVQTREPYQPWLVGFIRNGSKKCEECLPVLNAVADRCGGFMYVGTIDQDKEPIIAFDHGVKKNWTAVLFNGDGYRVLDIPCEEEKYYHLLADSLPNTIQEARPEWLKTSKKKPSLVFVKHVFKPNSLMKAVGAHFSRRGVRVGLCTERESFMKFGVRDEAKIVYINRTDTYNIPVLEDYKTLRRVIGSYVGNEAPAALPVPGRVLPGKRFEEECVTGTVCVVHASRTRSRLFELRRERFGDSRVRLFSGMRGLPEFMGEGELWVIGGGGSPSVKVIGFNELDSEVERALRGEGVWNSTGSSDLNQNPIEGEGEGPSGSEL